MDRASKRGGRGRKERGVQAPLDCLVVPGRRTVEYGLAACPNRCVEILFSSDAARARLDLPPGTRNKVVDPAMLDELAGAGVSHGGVVAFFRKRVVDFRAASLAQKLSDAPGCGLVLDGVTDPRNLGAILRSALWFGVPWVIVPERNAAPLNGPAAKTSAGAVLSVDVIRVKNLARALDDLKKEGVWLYAAVGGESSEPIGAAPINHPCALIVGDEGKGVRPNVQKRADLLVSIPGNEVPGFDSLNVSVATGILLQRFSRFG